MNGERIVVTRQPPGRALAILESEGSVWTWPEDRPIDRQVLLDQITYSDRPLFDAYRPRR